MIENFGVKVSPVDPRWRDRWLTVQPNDIDCEDHISSIQVPIFPFTSWEAAQEAFTEWRDRSFIARKYKRVAQLVALDMEVIPNHAIEA